MTVPTPKTAPTPCVRCGADGTARRDRGDRVLCDPCAEAGSLAARAALEQLEALDRAHRFGVGKEAA